MEENKELLIAEAMCALMKLTIEEQYRILGKYAEKYGWEEFLDD